MWEMAANSLKLFVTGKLFLHMPSVIGLAAVGMAATAVAFIALLKIGVPLLGAVAIAAFAGGLLQPRLYKNLKYR
jgi:hypothetical protein